jgi:hypothetical protein
VCFLADPVKVYLTLSCNKNDMSVISTTGSSLKSTNIPAALLEAALFLDAGEKNRNGANPGLAPKNSISIVISSDDGTVNISATLPSDVTVGAGGTLIYNAKDYLGGTYAAFTAGGDVTATTRMDAFVQIAQMLSNAEKAVTPVEDQPNFVQVESSSESGNITVTATLPYNGTILAAGTLEVIVLDYL